MTTKPLNKTKQQPTETNAIAEPRVLKTKNSSIRKAAIDKPMTPKSIKPTDVPIARGHRRQHFDTRSHRQIPQEQELAQLVYDKDTGKFLNYQQLIKSPKHKELWTTLAANEFGRLAQGVGTRIPKDKATNTIFFIQKDQVPKDRTKDVTYGSFSCDFKPNKEEKYRTRRTAGGDRINFPGDCGTPTADMTLFKVILNSTISTKGAQMMTIDLANFYLNTPMPRHKFMQLKIANIPEKVIKQYNLRAIVTEDGFVYCKICKGMYGLPQLGIIAQELLEERLARVGYRQSKIIPGLWSHNKRSIIFCLVVDTFAVKYTQKEDVDHLLVVLKQDYIATKHWEATKYLGLTIQWDHIKQKVHLWMPGNVKKTLIHSEHKMPEKKQDSPHPHIIPAYRQKDSIRRE